MNEMSLYDWLILAWMLQFLAAILIFHADYKSELKDFKETEGYDWFGESGLLAGMLIVSLIFGWFVIYCKLQSIYKLKWMYQIRIERKFRNFKRIARIIAKGKIGLL